MNEVGIVGLDEEFEDKINPLAVDFGKIQLNQIPPEEEKTIRNTIGASKAIVATDRPGRWDRFPTNSLSDLPPNTDKVKSAAKEVLGFKSQLAPSLFDVVKEVESPNDATIAKLQEAFTQGAAKLQNLQPSNPIEETPDSDLIKLALEDVGTVKGLDFPNLAHEIVELGLEMENYQTEHKLNEYQKQAHEHKATIDLLLKLSARLQKLPSDVASHKLSDDVQSLLEKLKAKDLDIFPESNGKITKEQLASSKSLIGSHIDQQRLKLQDIFTTKISMTVQFMNTMVDVMKNVIRGHDRLLSTISRNSGRGG